MKTARFRQVVAACGRPSVHLLWVKPEQDRELMRAFEAHRVMSIHQAVRGTAKDFGSVGLLKDRQTQLLVFPRSLRRFEGRRIVGIDYTLLAPDPAPARAAPPAPPKSPRSRTIRQPRAEKRPAPPRSPPAPKPAPPKPPPPPKPELPPAATKAIRQALRDLGAGREERARERLRKLLP